MNHNSKILIIVPNAGFGNRIRAVASGILLANKLGRTPYLCWPQVQPYDRRANVREMQILGWEGFFEQTLPIANNIIFSTIDRIYSEWMPGDGWYPVQNYIQREWKTIPHEKLYRDGTFLKDRPENIIAIETSLAVSLNEINWNEQLSVIYKQYFIPKQSFIDKLGTQRYDIGISIRKGDLGLYFSEANQSDALLRDWIVSLSQKYHLIIFSDDEQCQKEFREIANISQEYIEPFLQFLTLSLRCTIICGTPRSSFAEEAAIFGGIPYYPNLSHPDNFQVLLPHSQD
jgi:hypothetical protein